MLAYWPGMRPRYFREAVTLALVGLNTISFTFDTFYTLPTFRKLFVSLFKEVGAWLVNRKR